LNEGKTVFAGEPHKALASIRVHSIDNFDTGARTIEFLVTVSIFWQDGELIGKKHNAWSLDDLEFKPHEFEFVDAIEVSDEPGNHWIRNAYSKYGIAQYYQKFRVKVFQRISFRTFPFDIHRLKLAIVPKSESAEYLEYIRYDEYDDYDWYKSIWKDFALDEWYFSTDTTMDWNKSISYHGEEKTAMIFTQGVARKTHYYVWNVLWLVYFLNIITWCVFIISPDDLSDRLSVSITIFLSELAFNLIISGVLPRVSYNTWFSIYFLVNYLSIALQCIESVFVYLLQEYVDINRVMRIDYSFAVLFVIIHTLLLIGAYFVSRKHDSTHQVAIELEKTRFHPLALLKGGKNEKEE